MSNWFDLSDDEREEVIASPQPPRKWLDLCDGLVQIPSRDWYEWHRARGHNPFRSQRPAIPTRVRREVLDRDGLKCGICGGDVDPSDVHLDHIKQWAEGGEHSTANLRVTHSRCNLTRKRVH